jgi:hypothetical protein
MGQLTPFYGPLSSVEHEVGGRRDKGAWFRVPRLPAMCQPRDCHFATIVPCMPTA